MTRSHPDKKLFEFDPEIERSYRKLKNQLVEITSLSTPVKSETATMAEEQRPMREAALPTFNDNNLGILAPEVAAAFELKPSVIHMVQHNQFGGGPTEDPSAHLKAFIKLCNTFKVTGVSTDAVRLRLFPFSLRGRAAQWEESLQPGQITTWAKLVEVFLQKFFPPGRTAQLTTDITSFKQWDGETFYEAWERYKDMLKQCPHHGLQNWLVLQIFCNGVHPQYKSDIMSTAGGSLMNKPYEQAVEILNEMADHSFTNARNEGRSGSKKAAGAMQVDDMSAIKAQLASITNQLKNLNSSGKPPPIDPEFQDLAYPPSDYEHTNTEPVQYVQNQNQYNSNWKRHPGFSWSQQAQPSAPTGPYRPPGYHQR